MFCYVLPFHAVLPGSQLGRGSHCNFLHHRELGRVFHCVGVESQQLSLSGFSQSCTSWNRSSTSSKASPECLSQIQTFHNFYQSTLQSIGQGKPLQLLVSSRTGQDAPLYLGWVTMSLPLLLCPGSPHWQDLEQELHSLQPLTWKLFSMPCLQEWIWIPCN